MEPENLQNLSVDFIFTSVVNFAMQQNHIPIIRKVVIKNKSGQDLKDISIQFSFEPEFAIRSTFEILLIHDEETVELKSFDIKLSAKYLSELTERFTGIIYLTILSGEKVIFKGNYNIDILAFDQWQGISIVPEIISTFITPNNPHISKIISRSSEILNEWTGSPSLDEYQSRNPDRVKKQMGAVFEALKEYNIVYCAPPASFEETGQRVRMIDTILSQKIGTCLDMSLIYASCLEAIGIHPIIVIIKGHAFAGGWLIDNTFADSICDDPSVLSKRIAEGIDEILLVETTCLNSGNTAIFDDAIKLANYRLTKTDDFQLFVDVTRSRFASIRPLPQRVKTELGWEIIEHYETNSDRAIPKELGIYESEIPQTKKEVSKQQLWERKLLDLTLRNNLLNLRITQSTIQLISVSLNKLEDALAEGDEFQILSKPTDWENPFRNAGVYQKINQTDPIIELVLNELAQKRLRTYLTEFELVKGLTNLYRSSRMSLEENGANTLYLCLGLLKWYETQASERPRFAPLLLLPVEIIRKSALKGYIIRSREEETLMNITLLEMLRQDFKIVISGIDPLPRDNSGVDVKRIFNKIRQAIMPQSRWDVEEQAILGTFSFNKFIMWNDIHNNAGKLIQNKIVASLISGKAEWDVTANEFETVDLDEKFHPSEVITPISADSSQLDAICSSAQNKSFILHGPPGTGKSQTITNIIAHALFYGKKVLFVAEKMAALSVVQRRLELLGLAPFCVELHSNKSKKSYLLEQFKRTTEIVRTTAPEDFQHEAERIHKLRIELNRYVGALHKQYPFGFSLHDAFSEYASLPVFDHTINFNKEVIENLSKEIVILWTDLAEELKAAGTMCGSIYKHPLSLIRTLHYSQQQKNKIIDLLKQYSEVLVLQKNYLTKVCNECCINVPIDTKDQAQSLNEICYLILTSHDIPPTLLKLDHLEESVQLIIKLSEHAILRNRIREPLLKIFYNDILQIDAKKLKVEWANTLTKWFLPRIFGQQKVYKSFKAFSIIKKLEKKKIPDFIDDIIDFQAEQSFITKNAPFVSSILDSRWRDGEGDWEEIMTVCKAVLHLNNLLVSCISDSSKLLECKISLADKLAEGFTIFKTDHKEDLQGYQVTLSTINELEKLICEQLEIDFNSLECFDNSFIENKLLNCKQWESGIDSLREWISWNNTKTKAEKNGLTDLVKVYEDGKLQNNDVVLFFKKNLYRNCAQYIIEKEEQLSTFNGKMFEEKIRKFRELNSHFEQLIKQELCAKLASRIPSFTKEAAQSSEIGILQRNIRNGGRGISIRKLIDTIPNLLTRICPCMLMSPISVAQYIDVDSFKFDLVIFDEASQMPTCEAVGAIARGDNLIVVGDPKQLPPTAFFTSNNIDEENIEKEDLESILDDCLALSLPSKHLLWHYRSKHESLIAFSNSHYYENRLLTFPSPDDLITKVKFCHIKGYYDRGKTRQNQSEANAVVDEIISRLSDPILSKQSIGVVTFSSAQQILIDDLLTDAFMLRPDLEVIANESSEPLFIKNLENVQGDERDVILFSVGYGPDKEGKVNLNFGPINRDGGWRRLNVAVSRSRYEMKVFSTLNAEQIDITRTTSQGVIGLKAFLEFAERGKYSSSINNSKKSAKISGVITDMASRLNKEGFNVKTNIGCSGFKIDIGITNGEGSSEYIIGILCDGESYKESKTAKDREIIQTEVLKLLGWNIYKVWSCDWWDDPDKVINNIKEEIKDIKNAVPSKSTIDSFQKKEEALIIKESSTIRTIPFSEVNKYRKKYQICQLPLRSPLPQPEIFIQGYNSNTIREDILAVLEIEAPISKEMLIRRILSSWSLSRIGSRIEAYLDYIFKQMRLPYTESGKRFYWNGNQVPDNYLIYRTSEIESERRGAPDLPSEEVSIAVKEILENQISLSKIELIKETAHIFGFNRTGGNVESSMNRGIKKAINRGFAKIEDDRVFLVE